MAFSQKVDSSLLDSSTQLDLLKSPYRGLIDNNGIVFLVNEDGKSVKAISKENAIWNKNVVEDHLPFVGVKVIRHLSVKPDQIIAIFGKHCSVSLRKTDGAYSNLCCD